ncbi:MAG: tetratricopeptide repeat protein [Desulfomonile tiedjei]|nr:tetratricopeptide repeat protein [Desulfomonile tiedjei]
MPTRVKWPLAVFAVVLGLVAGSASFLSAADSSPVPRENTPEAVLEAADRAYNESRFQEAIRLYTQITKIVAPAGRAFVGRGMAHEMTNQPDKAVEDYKKALEADPDNYIAMENIAGIWERNGKNIPEAIELYRRALNLDPRPAWRENLAVWIGILETRLRSEGSSAVACWHKGNDKVLKGDLASAKTAYSKAIALNPAMFQAYYSRGLVRVKNGDLTGALKDFGETIRLSPTLRGCLVQRGLVWEQLGNKQAALEDFKRAAELDPRDPQAFYQLGRTLETEGNLEEALQSYRAAMALKPKPDLLKLLLERTAAASATTTTNGKRHPVGSKKSKGLW